MFRTFVTFFFGLFVFCTDGLPAYPIKGKVLLCGIGKNVAPYFSYTKKSMETTGRLFEDYRIVIYENNSRDGTKELFQNWQKQNKKVTVFSEDLSHQQLLDLCGGEPVCRIHLIAAFRNKLLDYVLQREFEDFSTLIMADMDFDHCWPYEAIRDVMQDERQWDAVLANGIEKEYETVYDTYAYIDDENVFTSVILGQRDLDYSWLINSSRKGDWRRVYSAFGGLGIYRREAIKGCRYTPYITDNFENLMKQWVREAERRGNLYLRLYEYELARLKEVKTVAEWEKIDRKEYPRKRGIKRYRNGLIWISNDHSLKAYQTVCEHITFHADMITHGHDKIFVHPRLNMYY